MEHPKRGGAMSADEMRTLCEQAITILGEARAVGSSLESILDAKQRIRRVAGELRCRGRKPEDVDGDADQADPEPIDGSRGAAIVEHPTQHGDMSAVELQVLCQQTVLLLNQVNAIGSNLELIIAAKISLQRIGDELACRCCHRQPANVSRPSAGSVKP